MAHTLSSSRLVVTVDVLRCKTNTARLARAACPGHATGHPSVVRQTRFQRERMTHLLIEPYLQGLLATHSRPPRTRAQHTHTDGGTEKVLIVTNDGRVIVVCPPRSDAQPPPLRNSRADAQGTLKGFDQATNVVVEKCHERVYRGCHEGAQDVPLGLYVIRGDNLFAHKTSTHFVDPTSTHSTAVFWQSTDWKGERGRGQRNRHQQGVRAAAARCQALRQTHNNNHRGM